VQIITASTMNDDHTTTSIRIHSCNYRMIILYT